MEWERAKSIILIAFLLLNAGLFGLLMREDRRYTVDSERIRNINTVLSENNISLYTRINTRFPPTRHLDVSGFYYDVELLKGIFFDGGEEITQLDTAPGHYLFETEASRLEIINGFVTFDNNIDFGENREAVTQAAALAVSDAFIAENFPDFVRDIIFTEDDIGGVRIIYNMQYRGQLVHSNFIDFLIVEEGIAWVDMQFGQVLGHSAETRMIFATDEILLTFMQRLRHRAMENPIIINRIDMVYYKEYASDSRGAVYPAVPFYRIFVDGEEFPFLINAFTNTLLD